MATSARADGRTLLSRGLLALGAGGATLYGFHLLLDPAPIAAGSAFAAGLVVMVGLLFRPMHPNRVVLGALAGALPAIWVHRGWHLGGTSPAPDSGMWPHLLGEGLLGLAVALACLGVTGLAWRALTRD